MSTLDSARPSLAVRRRLSSPISSCNSSNKPRSSSVIASYNLRRFSDHCEDAADVTEDEPDAGRDLEANPVSKNGVHGSLTTPWWCADSYSSNYNNPSNYLTKMSASTLHDKITKHYITTYDVKWVSDWIEFNVHLNI